MQKTKLGISVGALGAAVYFLGLFSGYLAIVVLVGYILLCEQEEWLKKSAVKAVVIMLLVSFATVILNMVPNFVTLINNLVGIFGGVFSIGALVRAISVLTGILDIAEKVLLLVLGVKALRQESISVPVVDKLISKYMG